MLITDMRRGRCGITRSIFLLAVVVVVAAAGIFSGCKPRPDTSVAPRPSESKPQPGASADSTPVTASSGSQDALTICSFNIQFLGNFKDKWNSALAAILAGYDIVVIQELVAPPYAMNFPDGTAVTPDAESAEFFEAMAGHGFQYVLSEEDTGTGETNHKNSSATEWWVAFFKPGSASPAEDLPGGFLADDRSDHPDYERVPYAFPFRTATGSADFVLISVHLQPGGGTKETARRAHELKSIATWVAANDDTEKDFIILGDMNIEDKEELAAATPPGFLSLNDECRVTNTNPNGPKPYDHVMYRVDVTREIDTGFDMMVVNLVEAMRPFWGSSDPTASTAPYPGDPYDHNEFRKRYSDHHPVVFRVKAAGEDDD